ncbi:phage late control D family protein [Cryptosporangium minutisporangium]|uniref:Phage protein D n=1 Tax=Cryptosporangium minutisporangium TaxID=113569 RepID=A0ABP6T1G6_9ACTN
MSPAQRRPVLRLWLDGVPLEKLGDWVLQVEVEERCDEASSLRLSVDLSPIHGSDAAGDWDALERGSFAADAAVPDFGLLRRVTVQFGLESDDPDGPEISSTVFDGYLTAVEPVFGEARVPDSRLELTGVDASCLMHFETVTRTWSDLTDVQIAREIFTRYGFAVVDAGKPGATLEDGGLDRPGARAVLVQRATDAEFLRMLARRNGFEAYVAPGPGPVTAGPHPAGSVVGHFHSPAVALPEQPALALFPRDAPTLASFRARYDSHQPTRIMGWHIDEQTRLLQRVTVSDPGYRRMGSHSRADVLATRLAAIQPVRHGTSPTPMESVDVQTSDVPHSAAEVTALARAELRLIDWFAAGTGTVLCERYPVILRAGRPIGLTGAGHLLDGSWYVRAVRHRWGVDPDEATVEQSIRRYEADVTLVRNALGGAG